MEKIGLGRLELEGVLPEPTRGLLATDHVILNHGQVTWTTPELAPPLLTITPHQREDVSALDRFNVHRCPTRWVFSGTGLELVTRRELIQNWSQIARMDRFISNMQGSLHPRIVMQ
ncbi:uncharacterized protein TNCV_3579391 [Trichonephila clavipes]|nr:uncharacterized protein TNCV_3579391 [Trichonephila clavipes]